MGSAKKIEEHQQYPYLVKQDGHLYNNPFDIFGNNNQLDHQFLKNNSVDCQIMQQNPSSSSSSSSSTPILNNLTITPRNIEDIWSVRSSSVGMANVGGGDMKVIDECIMREGAALTSGVNDQDHGGFIMPKMDPEMVSRWHQHEGMMSMPVEPVLLESKFSVVESGFESNMMDVGYLDQELKTSASLPGTVSAVADKSPDSQGQLENKGNFIDERMVKTIERRQRRMIKNRESAARSRAKKQAHTNRLEQSKLQLQATNDLLKKRKEVLLLLNSSSTSEPRYQLRRTSSATF